MSIAGRFPLLTTPFALLAASGALAGPEEPPPPPDPWYAAGSARWEEITAGLTEAIQSLSRLLADPPPFTLEAFLSLVGLAVAAWAAVHFLRRRSHRGRSGLSPVVAGPAGAARASGFIIRCVGFLLDAAFGISLGLLLLAGLGWSIPLDDFSTALPPLLLFLGAAPAYFIFFPALAGNSFGKLALGMRVVNRSDGAPAPAWRHLVRGLWLLLLPLEGLALLLNPNRRRLGDMTAGTRVIRPWKPSQTADAVTLIASLLLLGALFLFAYKSLALSLKNTGLYQAAINHLRRERGVGETGLFPKMALNLGASGYVVVETEGTEGNAAVGVVMTREKGGAWRAVGKLSTDSALSPQLREALFSDQGIFPGLAPAWWVHPEDES